MLALGGLVLGAVFELLIETPPPLLRWLAAQASAGQLQLAQTEGGLWSGSGELHWLRPAQPALALGRWQWSGGLAGVLPAWQLRSLAGPLQGGFRFIPGISGAALSDIALDGRAESLPPGLGSIDLLHPGGALSLRAARIELSSRGASGRGSLAWRQASTPLVAVSPLGSWRAEWTLSEGGCDYVLRSEAGPLNIEGHGRLQPDGHPSLQGRAWSDAASAAALQPVLRLLGAAGADGSVAIALP